MRKKLLGWGALVIGGIVLAHALMYLLADVSLIRTSSKWSMTYDGLATILGDYLGKAVAVAAWLCIAAGFLYFGVRFIKAHGQEEPRTKKRRKIARVSASRPRTESAVEQIQKQMPQDVGPQAVKAEIEQRRSNAEVKRRDDFERAKSPVTDTEEKR